MKNFIRRFGKDENGATSIEYALIAAFIGLVIITAVTNIGVELKDTFEDVQSGIKSRTP